MKNKTLNLNDPVDALEFLTKAMPDVLPGIDYVQYKDGIKKKFMDMNDQELVAAAIYCAPIFGAKYPDQTEIRYEH